VIMELVRSAQQPANARKTWEKRTVRQQSEHVR